MNSSEQDAAVDVINAAVVLRQVEKKLNSKVSEIVAARKKLDRALDSFYACHRVANYEGGQP